MDATHSKNLSISNSLKMSWQKLPGFKQKCWLLIIIFAFILFGLSFIPIDQEIFEENPWVLLCIIAIIVSWMTIFLVFYLLALSIQWAEKHAVSYNDLKPFYARLSGRIKLLFFLFLFNVVLMGPAIIFFLLPGFLDSTTISAQILSFITTLCYLLGAISLFYMIVKLYLSFGIYYQEKTSAWRAIKLSFKRTQGYFWKLFFLIVTNTLILFISSLTVIGLLWAIPWIILNYGVVYWMLHDSMSQIK